MRIAYLCADPDVQVLGQEGCSVHVRELANALVDQGHDVSVVCAWAGKGAPSQCKARIHELQPEGLDAAVWAELAGEKLVQDHHLERDLRSVLWNLWLRDRAGAWIERERPDFLYERYALFGSGGIELARRHGIPLILEVNAPLCLQQDGYEKFTFTRTARRMEGEILRAADALIVLSGWLKDWVQSEGVEPSRVHVIASGVAERFLRPGISGADVRAQHALHGARVVGFVGSFHWWHDVGGLLEAFAGLAEGGPDLRLLLVGDGEKRRSLERRARELGLAERVVFAGRVPHERVPEYVAAMDVAVVPYGPLKDFFFSPFKLFECMAVGRPVVAAAIGQIPEVVEDRVDGWLYPPGDNAKLAEGIGALLAAPERAEAMGKAARRTVHARHTWASIASQVTALARELIATRR